MQVLKQVKDGFDSELEKVARKNIIKKLEKQGIDHNELCDGDFQSLIDDEKEILKSDTKKVGAGIGIGIAISLLTGI